MQTQIRWNTKELTKDLPEDESGFYKAIGELLPEIEIPNRLHKYVPSMLLFLLFEAVAVTLWLTKDNFFYLLNFSYIGGCLALGTVLFTAGKRYARHFVQLAVGSYMLLYLGIISRENMQIEGFWYYLFLGVFEAATIHYAVAKIFGPLVFGREWCGYASWTAMVLDFLPYKQPLKPQKEKLGILENILIIQGRRQEN